MQSVILRLWIVAIIIPFEFYQNKFRFKTVVNGRECHFMLDNGSLWDELLFFGSPSVDSLLFEISGETHIGNTTADVAERITVGFSDVEFFEQTAVITRYNPDLPNPWEGFDGQVSATFLKHFVVRIDFDESCIELIPPDRFTYAGRGQVFSMHPGPFNSRTLTTDIDVSGGEPVTLDLLIDLGGLYPLYLPIGRDERITLPADAVEASLGSGLFSQKGYEGKIRSVRLGDYLLENIPAAFTVVKKHSNIYGNTMIGLPLLRCFNVVFDYFNEQIILEPSRLFGETFQAQIFQPKGPYFGQKPPGKEAEQFAPQIITYEVHESPSISPDFKIFWADAGFIDALRTE
jgi:hypothetical protein